MANKKSTSTVTTDGDVSKDNVVQEVASTIIPVQFAKKVPMKKVVFAREWHGCFAGTWYFGKPGETKEIPEELFKRLATVNGLLQAI